MGPAQCGDLVHLGGHPVQMHGNHGLGRPVEREGPLQRSGIHVPGLAFGVHEHRLRAAVDDRVGGRGERQALAEHQVAGADAGQQQGQMQRGGPGSERNSMDTANIVRDGSLEAVAVLPQRRDPVLTERVLDVSQFIALVRHVRTGQQQSLVHVSFLLEMCVRCPDQPVGIGGRIQFNYTHFPLDFNMPARKSGGGPLAIQGFSTRSDSSDV